MRNDNKNQGQKVTQASYLIGMGAVLLLSSLVGIFGQVSNTYMGVPRMISSIITLLAVCLQAAEISCYWLGLKENALEVARKKLNTAKICAILVGLYAIYCMVMPLVRFRHLDVRPYLLRQGSNIGRLVAAWGICATVNALKQRNVQRFCDGCRRFGFYGTLLVTALLVVYFLMYNSRSIIDLAVAILLPVAALYVSPKLTGAKIADGIVLRELTESEEAAL